MLTKLVCPLCRRELLQEATSLRCPRCGCDYPLRHGIFSFLGADESFNPTSFQEKQENAWSSSAQLRDRIRRNKLLTFLNWLRIKFSMSGRRDRIFHNEMHGGDPEALILDVGCGGGRHYFCDYGRVIGIDPVLELLEISKKIYAEVYHASAFQLPFADNSFDYVVSSDVIGHIPVEQKDKMFAEMYRVLRPSGKTVHVIETDAANVWFCFAHKYPDLFQKYFVEVPGHISLEMPTELQARFLRHGFKQIRFKKFAGAVQECGALSGFFNNEYKQKSRAVSLVVQLDRLLARSLVMKELVNLVLEYPAALVDLLTPLNSANGALVVFQK